VLNAASAKFLKEHHSIGNTHNIITNRLLPEKGPFHPPPSKEQIFFHTSDIGYRISCYKSSRGDSFPRQVFFIVASQSVIRHTPFRHAA
jgi:hypothetical protein